MLTAILFVISAVCVIMFALRVISILCHNQMCVSIPILHILDLTFASPLIHVPALAYQVYFWGCYYGVII